MESTQVYFDLESNCQSQVDKSWWHLEFATSKHHAIKIELPTNLTLLEIWTLVFDRKVFCYFKHTKTAEIDRSLIPRPFLRDDLVLKCWRKLD